MFFCILFLNFSNVQKVRRSLRSSSKLFPIFLRSFSNIPSKFFEPFFEVLRNFCRKHSNLSEKIIFKLYSNYWKIPFFFNDAKFPGSPYYSIAWIQLLSVLIFLLTQTACVFAYDWAVRHDFQAFKPFKPSKRSSEETCWFKTVVLTAEQVIESEETCWFKTVVLTEQVIQSSTYHSCARLLLDSFSGNDGLLFARQPASAGIYRLTGQRLHSFSSCLLRGKQKTLDMNHMQLLGYLLSFTFCMEY
jgi:hypothetical protein